MHAELGLQLGGLFGEGLDHLDLPGGQAALEQAANDGAGHVAAAYKGNLQGVDVVTGLAHSVLGCRRDGVPDCR